MTQPKIIHFSKFTLVVLPNFSNKKFYFPKLIVYTKKYGAFRLFTINCYGFATGKMYDKQPNNILGEKWNEKMLQNAVINDGYEIVPIDYECNHNEYKVMGLISDCSDIHDYHFYRLINGNWYHKHTYEKPSCLDASGNVILDPMKSNNEHNDHNYNKFAVCFKVKTNLLTRIYLFFMNTKSKTNNKKY